MKSSWTNPRPRRRAGHAVHVQADRSGPRSVRAGAHNAKTAMATTKLIPFFFCPYTYDYASNTPEWGGTARSHTPLSPSSPLQESPTSIALITTTKHQNNPAGNEDEKKWQKLSYREIKTCWEKLLRHWTALTAVEM